MKYDSVVPATFISRPNRFIAHVQLEENKNDKIEIVHVKNTGRCKELLIPGCKVYLEKSNKPNRKTKFDLIAVEKIYPENHEKKLLVNMDSQLPNKVAHEWLKTQNYSFIKPEFTFGKSRIDFYMEKDEEKFLMEVKGCTLEIDGIGYFPDAPTERGVKHLEELILASQKGKYVLSGFALYDKKNEATNAINAVIAKYGYTQGFLDVYDLVDAAFIHIHNKPEGTKLQ